MIEENSDTGTQLLRTTIDVKEYVKNEFIKLEKEIIIPHRDLFPNTITLDDFFWAFGMVRSRAFSRLGQNLVVIPLADLVRPYQLCPFGVLMCIYQFKTFNFLSIRSTTIQR